MEPLKDRDPPAVNMVTNNRRVIRARYSER